MRVTREKLYEEVWVEPMTTVAKRYDVSSSFLARVCERLHVPRPPRGYWAQLKAGHKLNRPRLADPNPGDDIEWSQEGTPKVHVPATPPAASSTGEVKPTAARRRARGEHPLLIGARSTIEAGRVSRNGYLKPYKRNIVDVYASKDALDRALSLAGDLFRSLELRGHHVMLAPPDRDHSRAKLDIYDKKGPGGYDWDHWAGPARITVAMVNGTVFGLTLFEVCAEFGMRWNEALKTHVRVGPPIEQKIGAPYNWTIRNDWLPSGRLGLHVYAPGRIEWGRYWREEKRGELRTLLEDIGEQLERAVPTIQELVAKREREDAEERRKAEEQHRAWRRQEEERLRIQREKEFEQGLVGTIERWRTARDIRSYVGEINALIEGGGLKLTAGGEAEKQLNHALAYADKIDPLTAWKKDVERVQAEHSMKPCPKCGEFHRGGAEQPTDAESREPDDGRSG